MANLALHPCTTPGCRELVRGQAKCERHASAQRAQRKPREWDKTRETNAAERGYDHDWQKVRDRFIAANPLCYCGARAEMVHHINAVANAPDLRLSVVNLVAVCRACHAKEHRRTHTPTGATLYVKRKSSTDGEGQA